MITKTTKQTEVWTYKCLHCQKEIETLREPKAEYCDPCYSRIQAEERERKHNRLMQNWKGRNLRIIEAEWTGWGEEFCNITFEDIETRDTFYIYPQGNEDEHSIEIVFTSAKDRVEKELKMK